LLGFGFVSDSGILAARANFRMRNQLEADLRCLPSCLSRGRSEPGGSPLAVCLDEFDAVAERVVDVAADHVGNFGVPPDWVSRVAKARGKCL
jgi:hypothetical protein